MLLLRHASAGERLSSPTLDRERPLDREGRGAADRLSASLVGHVFEHVVTSPHARCVETVRPLVLSRGLAVELRDELTPGAHREHTLALLDELSAATLVCTHREVIERLFGELECEKAGGWRLERVGGRWLPTAYFPPPSIVKLERVRTVVG